MGDINLFSLNEKVTQLSPSSFQLERKLQMLIEKNMYTFFGVTFLQSGFRIPKGGNKIIKKFKAPSGTFFLQL